MKYQSFVIASIIFLLFLTLSAKASPPKINLSKPLDYYNTNATNITFNFTAIDDIDTSLRCNLTINGIVNITNIEATNGIPQINVTNNFNDGLYYWNVTCGDSDNNTNTSTTKTFSVDIIQPIISNLRNTSTTNESSFIEFDCNENCNYSISWYDSNVLVGSSSNNTFAFSHKTYLSSLTNSTTYFINLTVWDLVGNIAVNNTFNFTTAEIPIPDTTPPIIEFSAPSNITNNVTIIFIANFSDSRSGFATNNSCELCVASDAICDKEWSSSNITTTYSIDYSSGSCSYFWNISKYRDSLYNISFRIKDIADNIGVSSKEITLDRNPPILYNLYPRDNGAFTVTNVNPENVSNSTVELTFSYRVDDLSSIVNCTFIFNGKINNTDTDIRKDKYEQFSVNILTNVSNTQYYNWSIACIDIYGHERSIDTRSFTIIVMSNFSGETTDLGVVNLSRIENLTFEQVTSGKIKFSDIVNLSGISDINQYVKISYNKVEIDTSVIPVLNKSATLYIYNLRYNDTPKILRNNITCPATICKIINYSNGTLIFNVTQFSVYSTEEALEDSGSSGGSSSGEGGSSGGGSSGGGGSGGGGGGAFFVCNMGWECNEWSECINGQQTRECSFFKVPQHTSKEQCPTNDNPPITTQDCEVQKEITAPEPKNETKIEKTSATEQTELQTELKPKEQGGFAPITGNIIGHLFATSGRSLKLDLTIVSLLLIGIIGFFTYRKFKLTS